MRRVVTAVNEKGESYVASDDTIADSGFIWRADPQDYQDWIEAIDPDKSFTMVQPPPRGVVWVLVEYPPGAGMEPTEHPAGMDERGFHWTRTIDFCYVIDGGVVLDLDLESVELHSGDVVVLQAPHHAWRNPTDRPVRFIDVLVSGERD
jgi:hypothetical protein